MYISALCSVLLTVATHSLSHRWANWISLSLSLSLCFSSFPLFLFFLIFVIFCSLQNRERENWSSPESMITTTTTITTTRDGLASLMSSDRQSPSQYKRTGIHLGEGITSELAEEKELLPSLSHPLRTTLINHRWSPITMNSTLSFLLFLAVGLLLVSAFLPSADAQWGYGESIW